jgi:DNA-binding NarL/FixJ family response regulator
MLRIVIAEPDAALSLWLAAAIAPAQGFEVVGTAVDGESALDVVRRTHPDVVLVDADIVMPPHGGLTLVAAIREAVPETLVVVLAAEVREETALAALAAGATSVLRKDGSAQLPADLDSSQRAGARAARPRRGECTYRERSTETAHTRRTLELAPMVASRITCEHRSGASKRTPAGQRPGNSPTTSVLSYRGCGW